VANFAQRPLLPHDPFGGGRPLPDIEGVSLPKTGFTAVKCFLVNEKSGESLEVLLNPTAYPEGIQVVWAKQPVLGLSHEVLQYVRTVSMQTSFQLVVSEAVMAEFGITRAPIDYRNFFLGLGYPFVERDAPTDVLFVWPQITSIRGVIEQARINHQRFNLHTGGAMDYTIDITIIERRSSLRTHALARQFGFRDPDIRPVRSQVRTESPIAGGRSLGDFPIVVSTVEAA